MSKIPQFDAKISQILANLTPGERICAITGEKWDMTEEEIGWYRKFNVPPSTISPVNRWRLMTSYFCGWQWWYAKHPETGKPVLSFVHPATGYKVLPEKEWFQKDFSHITHEYNSEQPFFEQFYQMHKQIPVTSSIDVKESINSISLVSLGDEDSFFTLGCRAKRSFNCSCALDIEDCAEIVWADNLQNCFNVTQSNNLFGCRYVKESRDCINSMLLFDCRNCENCFGAFNKRNKKYLWFNEELSKDEWEKRFSEIDLSCRSKIKPYIEKFHETIGQEAIWPENFIEASENCTGEYISGGTNLSNCFASKPTSKDMFWVCFAHGGCSNCAFCAGVYYNTDCYYSVSANSSRSLYCYEAFRCQETEYCQYVFDCEYCFGCSGIRRKKFCIFNKQYSEDEYWQKLDEIKCNMLDRGEYGEFFPAKYSPSYYPDAGALVLDAQDMGEAFGALDFDPESMGAIGEPLYDESKMRSTEEIPDCINSVKSEEWVGVPIMDPKVNRRFGFVRPEIEFYKKNQIPLPNVHFIPRIKQLYFESNSGVFDQSTCDKCKKKITIARNITYKNRKIYCKPCYLEYIEQYG